MNSERWLLPEGIEELLPPQAEHIELLRRRLLDLFRSWGYDLVIPPLVEFLDSLLTGTGNDLDIQTFKLTDQLSGRLMGVRADITPQVARIAAHRMADREDPIRLCYAGTVLHTRAGGPGGSRSFIQVGAELYGHGGIDSDAEMLSLMLESLRCAGITQVYLDIGNVGIFHALTRDAGLTLAQENTLFEALQRKAVPEVEALVSTLVADAGLRKQLVELVWLNGGEEVLGQASRALQGKPRAMTALDELKQLAEKIRAAHPSVPLHFDLAELRGFNYHTGVVFAAYHPASGSAIAQGGRYDDIGEVFGRSRPATGFSADLRSLAVLGAAHTAVVTGIHAPLSDDAALREKIRALRAEGERVICALPGQDTGSALAGCDRRLMQEHGQWSVKKIGTR